MGITIGKHARTRQLIDEYASEACTLMNDEDRLIFFAEYSRDKTRGLVYKGVNKGKLKYIYNVDGLLFNKIWKLVEAYVRTASIKSNLFKNFEVDDSIFYIRERLFYNMLMYGGRELADRIKLIVNNSLTIESKVRQRNKASVFQGATSLDTELYESGEIMPEGMYITPEEAFDREFWMIDIPDKYIEAVEEVMYSKIGRASCRERV